MGTVESKIGCVVLKGFGGVTVDEMCGGVKSLDPKERRKAGLKEQRAHDVIKGTKHVIKGGVGTGHP